MVDEIGNVPRHVRRTINRRIVDLFRATVTAIVQGYDLIARLGQFLDPAGRHPVDVAIRCKAMDGNDGPALAMDLIGKSETFGLENRHKGFFRF